MKKYNWNKSEFEAQLEEHEKNHSYTGLIFTPDIYDYKLKCCSCPNRISSVFNNLSACLCDNGKTINEEESHLSLYISSGKCDSNETD